MMVRWTQFVTKQSFMLVVILFGIRHGYIQQHLDLFQQNDESKNVLFQSSFSFFLSFFVQNMLAAKKRGDKRI